jgi:hypothetical protein
MSTDQPVTWEMVWEFEKDREKFHRRPSDGNFSTQSRSSFAAMTNPLCGLTRERSARLVKSDVHINFHMSHLISLSDMSLCAAHVCF